VAEQKPGMSGLVKWGLIIGVIIFIAFGIVSLLFIFALPSMLPGEGGELAPVQLPEIGSRLIVVVVIFVVGIVFVLAVAFVIYEIFFKKKELHIVQEHHKVVKDATMLNPVSTLGNLILTGQNKIQHYSLGKIIGHTQVPVSFERHVVISQNGQEHESSESYKDYLKRKAEAKESGRDKYDFFAFTSGKGVYGLPIFNLLEPVKIFACYPSERSPDLIGDVEILDVGTWKVSGVNIFVPAQRNNEPMFTAKEFEAQLFPIAYMSLLDYLGLIAQRGVEGDTALQKWLETKSSSVNVKEKAA